MWPWKKKVQKHEQERHTTVWEGGERADKQQKIFDMQRKNVFCPITKSNCRTDCEYYEASSTSINTRTSTIYGTDIEHRKTFEYVAHPGECRKE